METISQMEMLEIKTLKKRRNKNIGITYEFFGWAPHQIG